MHGRLVKYSKREIINQELNRFSRAELSLVQKPAVFNRESEYRLYTIPIDELVSNEEGILNIELGQQIHYAEFI